MAKMIIYIFGMGLVGISLVTCIFNIWLFFTYQKKKKKLAINRKYL